MVTTPHHLASEAGLKILRAGGNAVEAAVAAAAAIAVVYPHMTGIGGDGFWLISEPGKTPVGVLAAGPAGKSATIDRYKADGLAAIPSRGSHAALTVAGTIDGWRVALDHAKTWGGKPIPLSEILSEAVYHARSGWPVTRSQAFYSSQKIAELKDAPGFADQYLPGGAAPATAELMKNPAIAATLERLAHAGLDDFYRGDVAQTLGRDLAAAGALVGREDLAAFHAETVAPLSVNLPMGTVYNLPAPTQGLASLIILGIFCRLNVEAADGYAHIHALVEATKRAFAVRDSEVADPGRMTASHADFLSTAFLSEQAAEIHPSRAAAWGAPMDKGDTIWLGVTDGEGRSVSLIQSLYWEFGSGVVSPGTGIVWQNRGMAFSLDPEARRALAPGRRPFHTLNPAFARFKDGRELTYGSMGGDGQPQFQSSIFTRYALFGQTPQQAVSAPRWLLGKTWGQESMTLKLEDRFPEAVFAALATAGHPVEKLSTFSDTAGHAGMIARLPSGVLEGAQDPRSDGAVATF